MPAVVATAGIAVAAVLVTALWPMPAAADRSSTPAPGERRGERRDELDRWVPSLGVFGGFQQQSADGEVDPSMLLGPQCTETRIDCEIDRQIQPFDSGDDELRRFRAGFTAELMSPRLLSGFGHPRLFVHIDPILSEGFERSIAGTGNPGPMIEGELAVDARRSDAQAFSGQGSRVLAEVQPFILNVGFGVAFTVDAFDRRIRIKPSAEYVRETLTVTGQVNRVVQVAQIPRPNTPSDFRFITLQDRNRETYDALGPGLEIEIDADQIGPFTISPFAAAHAHYFFGNLDVTLRDSNEFGESTEWRFSRDAWQWTARFGIRLRWAPE